MVKQSLVSGNFPLFPCPNSMIPFCHGESHQGERLPKPSLLKSDLKAACKNMCHLCKRVQVPAMVFLIENKNIHWHNQKIFVTKMNFSYTSEQS